MISIAIFQIMPIRPAHLDPFPVLRAIRVVQSLVPM